MGLYLQLIANAKHDLSKMANDGEQRQFLSTYQSATLSESNCSSYYELAVEANNESLQVGIQTSRKSDTRNTENFA